MAQHEELGRHAVELLADLFADALEGLAALAVRLVDLVVTLDARQARGSAWRIALRLGGVDAAGCGLVSCSAARSSSAVSARMRSNSTSCVVASRLSLDEPKRQRLSRAISKFSASILV